MTTHDAGYGRPQPGHTITPHVRTQPPQGEAHGPAHNDSGPAPDPTHVDAGGRN